MFSARCYQNAKNMYEKTKMVTATNATSFEVFPMVSDMLDMSESDPKLFAIEPIMRAIEGSIKPAIMAPRVPMASIQLSLDEL